MKAIKNVFLLIGSIACASLLLSADLHHATSVDPISMLLKINIGNEQLDVNLDAPGLVMEKFPSGHMKHLTVPFVNSVWKIYFHDHEDNRPLERVALVQRFRLMNNRLVLQGRTESYNDYGMLTMESKWEEGKLHGVRKWYTDAGQLLEVQDYEHGVPINTWEQYYVNGEVAVGIEFPSSKAEWDETSAGGHSYLEESVFSMSYHKPLLAIEVWYDEDGMKIKELEYNLYKDEASYVVSKTGRAKSFNLAGDIIQEEDFSGKNGSGWRKHFYSKMGLIYETHQTWFNGNLFNSVTQKVRQ
ncbi:MAG: antitoxin component YwqK of YwqJK toxin-antitoxin module [Chlamydiales bacterium]|jgi:antitoxin component YwqK of YwqJK toxin-antitoxin module